MKRLKTKEYDDDPRITGLFNNSTLAIARFVIKKVSPDEKLHYHAKNTEYYIFLQGKAEMIIKGKMIKIVKGDVLIVEPGEKHKVTKIIEELDYIVIRDTTEDDKIIVNE